MSPSKTWILNRLRHSDRMIRGNIGNVALLVTTATNGQPQNRLIQPIHERKESKSNSNGLRFMVSHECVQKWWALFVNSTVYETLSGKQSNSQQWLVVTGYRSLGGRESFQKFWTKTIQIRNDSDLQIEKVSEFVNHKSCLWRPEVVKTDREELLWEKPYLA